MSRTVAVEDDWSDSSSASELPAVVVVSGTVAVEDDWSDSSSALVSGAELSTAPAWSEDSSPASNEGSFEASRSASSSESPLAIARRTKRPIGMTKRFVLSQGRSPESFENQFRTGSSADGRAPRLSLNPSPLVIGGVEEAEECSSTGEAPEAGGGGAALFGGGGRRELFGSEGSSTAIQEK